ncbi:MAG: AAA family ATPase [Spirochaetales bacterium]|nr:AAA family ATPase [Spirochaetales bacterium]
MEALPYLREVSVKNHPDDLNSKYPFSIPAINSLTNLKLGKNVTFFIGENGSGKSTLLEALAIALGFNAEGGSVNYQFSTRDSHSNLYEYLSIVRSYLRPKDGFFLRAESFFNVATNIEEMDSVSMNAPSIIGAFGNISLHAQSHGESFWSLLMNRFFGKGLYLLDEPEAALSPARQLSALSRIHQLAENSSQFIIATHSPILMAYPGALIYEFSREGIKEIEYEETDHYQITKSFLNNREIMLKELF